MDSTFISIFSDIFLKNVSILIFCFVWKGCCSIKNILKHKTGKNIRHFAVFGSNFHKSESITMEFQYAINVCKFTWLFKNRCIVMHTYLQGHIKILYPLSFIISIRRCTRMYTNSSVVPLLYRQMYCISTHV